MTTSLVLIMLAFSVEPPCEFVKPEFQSSVEKLLAGKYTETHRSREELRAKLIEDVKKSVANDDVELLLQWARLMECLSDRNVDERVALLISVLPSLAEPSLGAVREAGIKLLVSENEYQRTLAPSILQHGESLATTEVRNHYVAMYADILPSLIDTRPREAEALIRYMLDSESGATLLVLLNVVKELEGILVLMGSPEMNDRSVLGAPSDLDQTNKMTAGPVLHLQDSWSAESIRRELAQKANSPRWYVRLWVVEVMRQVPALKIPEVGRTLQMDPNDLVRDRANLSSYE